MVNLNKPIEDMKNDIIWGLDARELVVGGITIAVAICNLVLLILFTNLSPMICVYIGIPAAAPILPIGLYKIQGMTLFQYLKKKRWQKKVGVLIYEAQELTDEIFVWTMKRR